MRPPTCPDCKRAGRTRFYSHLVDCLSQDKLHAEQKKFKAAKRELQQQEHDLVTARRQLEDIHSQSTDASWQVRTMMEEQVINQDGAEARERIVDQHKAIVRALSLVIDRHMSQLQAEKVAALDADGDGIIDEVPFEEQYATVMFPDVGGEVLIRINEQYTFDQLLDDSCRRVATPVQLPTSKRLWLPYLLRAHLCADTLGNGSQAWSS